jgi:chorismate dehydratase
MGPRILLVNNVSAEPFRLVAPGIEARLDELPPALAWRAAAQGQADLALLPVAKLADVADRMEPIGDFGVACEGAVGSVLFLGHADLRRLLAEGQAVHLTAESETSRRLLGWLCREEFGRAPAVAADPSLAAGRLAIGDEALRLRQQAAQWPVIVDLGDWWWRRTRLPFVFARWMIRRDAPASLRQAALGWLNACADAAQGPAGREAMVRRALGAGLFATSAEASDYFRQLRSRFRPAELAGEQAFLRALQATPA